MKARFPQLSAIAGGFLLAGSMFSPSALAIDFSDCGGGFACPYVTYGDGNSYSLPVNALLYDIYLGGGTGPGNPYYVTSTPGAIKDLTVIGTGASGGPVNTNVAGMDNAYPTPNADSGGSFFTTNKTVYGGSEATCDAINATVNCSAPDDPTQVSAFSGDTDDTWDVRLTALASFLGTGNTPIFFFNNNQTNSADSEDQNLAIWARITLHDDEGVLQDLNLYFTNLGGKYALVSEGGGGVLNGTAGTGTLGAASGPTAGDNDSTDYVLSGGALCYDGLLTIVSCSDASAVGGPINHNLGANQAVYAVVFPKLDEIIATAGFNGYDVLQLDWRMGCDPNTTDAATTCQGTPADGETPLNHGRFLNNGYEQLFIATKETVFVPLPSSIALLGVGLIGLAAVARRRKVTQ